jgi:hypothetical protein
VQIHGDVIAETRRAIVVRVDEMSANGPTKPFRVVVTVARDAFRQEIVAELRALAARVGRVTPP